MEKIPDFNDLIFESRNKKYGAYTLRKSNNRILTISTLIGVMIALIAILVPFQIQKKSVNRIIAEARNAVLIEMEDFVPPQEKIYVPPPPTATPGQLKAIKYIAPEVVDSVVSTERTIVTADEAVAFAGDTTVAINAVGTGDIITEDPGGLGMDEPFIIVEEMPTFQGGDINTFRNWVQKRTTYPEEAVLNDIKGRVLVSFIIEKDGSISSITIMKSVHPLLDKEALRVISLSPKWKAGVQRGYKVRVKYTIPIIFQFDPS